MFKKVLVVVCAMSVFLMTGCINLGGVSQADYDAAMADRDMLLSEYIGAQDAVAELEEQKISLETEIADLEAEISVLEDEVEAAILAMEGGGEIVTEQITDDVMLKVQLPEDFSYYGDGLYSAGTYDPSNIIIQSQQTDMFGLSFSQEMIEAYFKQMYESKGYDVSTFEMKTFERSQINGYDTLVMEMYIEQSGMKVTQIAVVVQVEDVTCLVVYTTEESFGRYDEFWDSVKTIQVGKAK